MPGVKWHKWTPYFVEESDSLIDIWTEKVRTFLSSLPSDIVKVSSRSVKRQLTGTDKLAGRTWARVIQNVISGEPRHVPKESTGDGTVWKMEGQSLVRVTAESYGFEKIA